MQIYRDSHPRAFTLRFSGLLFLLMGASGLIAFVTAGRPWQLSLLIAVILLAVLTIPMALIIVFSSPARVTERARHDPGFTRFPADTDPAKLAAAWRLVRQGRLGPDPEANRLGRIVVEKELSSKSTTSSFLLIGMAALLNAFQGISRLLMEGVSPFVVVLLGLAILLSGLSVSVLFLAPRQRRRSEAFRDAYDDAAGEASGNAA
jgi:cell division protein FtsW (lipid II flippase)